MDKKEYSASEAKRLLEELAPYFAELEKRALDDMVSTNSWDAEADRKRLCSIERIKVMRDLQTQLRNVITIGASSVRARGVV